MDKKKYIDNIYINICIHRNYKQIKFLPNSIVWLLINQLFQKTQSAFYVLGNDNQNFCKININLKYFKFKSKICNYH